MENQPAMTGKERIMTALRGGQPDRVPVTPDISIMIPVKLTGKPFWEVEVNRNPPLTAAYINAANHFGIDGWMFNGEMDFQEKSPVEVTSKFLRRDEQRWDIQYTYHTPDGELTQTIATPRGDSSTLIEKMIKDFKKDFCKIRHLFSEFVSCDASGYRDQLKAMGTRGMTCIGVSAPGLHTFQEYFQGSLEAAAYAYYDYPDLFGELIELYQRRQLTRLELALENGAESILTGGSGSITLQSPDLFRELSLPAIQKITRICKQAGVLCGVHSCGKELALVEMCANETDLDYVNPLEIPPMGDCTLAACKQQFGKKIALMGNLHTTNVMLMGTAEQVRLESLKAIRDAGEGGGFVLSTGDQCGRDTPEENIFEMVRVGREFGHYPLDMDRIHTEIERLETTRKESVLI